MDILFEISLVENSIDPKAIGFFSKDFKLRLLSLEMIYEPCILFENGR